MWRERPLKLEYSACENTKEIDFMSNNLEKTAEGGIIYYFKRDIGRTVDTSQCRQSVPASGPARCGGGSEPESQLGLCHPMAAC